MSKASRRCCYPIETRLAVSLHWRSAPEGVVETIVTCVMSSTVEMHMAGSKTDAKNEGAQSRNNMMRGTMIIMASTMTILTDNAPPKEGKTREESKLSLVT
jgi:hypothetical protein